MFVEAILVPTSEAPSHGDRSAVAAETVGHHQQVLPLDAPVGIPTHGRIQADESPISGVGRTEEITGPPEASGPRVSPYAEGL